MINYNYGHDRLGLPSAICHQRWSSALYGSCDKKFNIPTQFRKMGIIFQAPQLKDLPCYFHPLLKSDNLQYNTLVCWADGTNNSSNKCLMFQVLFFFIKSCKILCKNPFNLFFYKITKLKIKSFDCPQWYILLTGWVR